SSVTPPDVPAGTLRPVVMSLGVARLSSPISVAQVSAVAAAIAPANAGKSARSGRSPWSAAIAVATPPFASTCTASRRPPFTTSSPAAALAAARQRVSALDAMKNATSRIAHAAPPTPSTTVPTTTAASAPSTESARARNAAAEMAAARTNARVMEACESPFPPPPRRLEPRERAQVAQHAGQQQDEHGHGRGRARDVEPRDRDAGDLEQHGPPQQRDRVQQDQDHADLCGPELAVAEAELAEHVRLEVHVDGHHQVHDDDGERDRGQHEVGEPEAEPDDAGRVRVRDVVEVVAVARPLGAADARERAVQAVAEPLDDEQRAGRPQPRLVS